MLIIGLSGGPNLINENPFKVTPGTYHDSACVLIKDGEVLCAIEEERINRIKHTNKFPFQSLRACLQHHRINIQDVDLISYHSTKEGLDMDTKMYYLSNPEEPKCLNAVSFFQQVLYKTFKSEVDGKKFRFVHHHVAHAMSAFAMCGFDNGLVVSIDGVGNDLCGMVLVGKGTKLRTIASFPHLKSLGHFYLNVIAYLGYRIFDEYKVMGLAPYGSPETYRDLFRQFYSLLPDGNYAIQTERLMSLFKVLQPRRKWEPITQAHKDIAASLQEALEDVVFHVIRHYQQVTKERNLCLAGGVAHNCTLNGKILASGLFENVFVQPAAHDAGGALGAALATYYSSGPKVARAPALKHVFWGTDIGDDQAVLKQLLQWQSFIDFRKDHNISETVAGLISSGSVIGWAQGRAEFGPRALGNRSILADPRPAENKDKINRMVKKREGFRPFAPSVLEEDADEYFDIPNDEKRLPFMIFVVKVKKDKRSILGAVTHVDGTARVQTVSRETNERFWRLIHAFKAITGIPILLNTSFNNNVEPIVDTVEDAIVCFLTTNLDYLVTGDYLITRKEVPWQAHLSLKPSLAAHITLNQVKMQDLDCIPSTHFLIKNSYDSDFQYALSARAYQVLMQADGIKTIETLINESCKLSDEEAGEIVQELLELWSRRLIILRP